MLIDEVTVHFKAGSGGRGAVEFSKTKMTLGPRGGSGGRGASIYLEGVADINALTPLASRKAIRALDGDHGLGQLTDGHGGEDLIVPVPNSTRVITVETGEIREITKVGERLLIAAGGRGGRGNYKFRSAVNTSPKQFEEGKAGEEVTLRLELRLIASVGLVGLPNAGKSSLLNELTAARSKVGNYPFTTLEPNLGSYYGLIIADIPGIIEGAATGKGLGVRFLKHIERTKTLFHLVSVESEDVVRDYNTIRAELEKFNPALLQKKEYILLSHADMTKPDDVKQKLEELRKINPNVIPVSIIDDTALTTLKKLLNTLKDEEGIQDT
ncbi:MAG: GTPase ObgE [Candidatus Andersenbacteria bacterium]|nr:GTPase ObgE [Candidatus Andersenbacteria bacterium]MBI3250975.1 GTPase ObgE [Candidatus Andersenbacteria bacterium]